jgi:hypothetical protein
VKIEKPAIGGFFVGDYGVYICATIDSPKAEQDTNVASSIKRSKSYVTVFA